MEQMHQGNSAEDTRALARRWVRVLWRRPLLTVSLFGALLFAAGQLLVYQLGESEEQRRRIEVTRAASALQAQLVGVMRADLGVVAALTSVFSADPDGASARFAELAAEMLRESLAIRHFAIAPDLIISDVYPEEGNEAALGLDYRQTPAQREMALQAMNSRATVLVGPQALVQGGSGFIARRAIVETTASGSDRLWGLVVVVLDPERVFAAAGLGDDPSLGVALQRLNAASGVRETVYGDPQVLLDNPVSLNLDLGTGDEWVLHTLPKNGWYLAGVGTWLGHLLAALIALTLMLLLLQLVRERNRLEHRTQDLGEAQELRASMTAAIPDMLFMIDAQDRFVEYHTQDTQDLFVPAQYFIGKRIAEVMPPAVAQPLLEKIAQARKTRTIAQADYELSGRSFEARFSPVGDSGRVLSITRETTARRASEEQMRLALAIFDNAGEGILLVARDGRVLMVNAAFSRLTGFGATDIVGKAPDMLHPPNLSRTLQDSIRLAVREEGQWNGELQVQRKDGSLFPAQISMSSIRKPGGGVEHYVLIFSDLSDSERNRDAIQHLLTHDAVTDLPNMGLLREQLELAVNTAQHSNQRLALLFISVDQFQALNATLGRQTVDQLLCLVAGRLQQHRSESESLARIGSRTFAMLMQVDDGLFSITQRATALQRSFATPLTGEDSAPIVSLHIGIARFPEDGVRAEQLLSNAESALMASRELSDEGETIRFYDAALSEAVRSRIELERRLRAALANRELLLHYQPIYRISDQQLLGFEALLRWQPAGEQLRYPNAFVDIIESTDLVYPVGRWVMDTAAQQLQVWLAEKLEVPRVSINVAAQQILGGRLADELETAAARHHIDCHRLGIEILERVLVHNHERALRELKRVRELGIRIALDDFGTGYSSLSYLREFPVDVLKIDRSFVHALDQSAEKRPIVRAIIAMAQNLAIHVTAEGVETEAEWTALKELGCDEAQGWLRGRPMDAAAATELLRTTQAAVQASRD